MKSMKKILCALIICACFTPVSALAENTEKYTINISMFSEQNQLSEPTDDEAELLHYLVSQFLEYREEIEIPVKYEIKSDRFSEIYSNYMGVLMQTEYPEMFYPDIAVRAQLNTDGTIKTLIAEYAMDADEVYQSRVFIYQELAKIKELLNENMTDVEKVLTVHDYIVSGYEYDTSVYDDPNSSVRTLDQMIIQKKGVCQGYASLFKFVMDNIGIECETVPSNECNHIWNKVKISVDGGEKQWYNIDVTTDDPLMDLSANISHKFFLVSDDEIKTDAIHYVWNEYKWDNLTPATVADSDNFSQSIIHNIDGQMIYKDGKWYAFILTNNGSKPLNNLCVVDIEQNTATPIYEHDSIWYLHGQNRIYLSPISSMVLFDGDIYFNSPNKIYKYDTESNTAEEIYDFEDENPDKNDVSKTYLYGLRVRGNEMYAEYTTKPYVIDGVIDEPHMDALIPIKEVTPDFAFWSGIKSVSDNEIIVYTNAPYENTITAQYDENGVFLGFAKEYASPFRFQYICEDSCKTIKTFIWSDKEYGYTPLAKASELTH